MNKQERLSACRAQFLYSSFLESNIADLKELHNSPGFMDEIRAISSSTPEELLYGVDVHGNKAKADLFQSFKEQLCSRYYRSLRFQDYPVYKRIYNEIHKTKTGASATISIFYALVYLDLLDSPDD